MNRAALLVVLAYTMNGQSFEVASIKLHEGPCSRIGVNTSGNRLLADCSSLNVLVPYAYNLKTPIVSTLPLWNDAYPSWDIVAKAEGDAVLAPAEFRQMLQSLLADRFQLKVHSEMRETPVFALVVSKGGPKFKASDPNDDSRGIQGMNGRNNVVTLPNATMTDLVEALRNALLDRPVVDKTGLTGTYNIKLNYTPNFSANRENPDLGDITVFHALEEQLGLKLEARKEPLEVLVVDHVERPSGN